MRLAFTTFLVSLFTMSSLAGTFRDDFEDGNLDGWLEIFAKNPEASVWKAQDGVLIGRRISGWGADLVIGDTTWEDYTIECDMGITERLPNEFGDKFHYAGVMGRTRAENKIEKDSLGFTLNLKESPTIWSYLWVNQVFSHNVQTPINVKLSVWHHLKSVIEGNNFKCYIDEDLVSQFSSAAIPTGQVGITIGGCVAEYDNVIVTGDKVPDVGPSGFAVTSKCKLATLWNQIKQIW